MFSGVVAVIIAFTGTCQIYGTERTVSFNEAQVTQGVVIDNNGINLLILDARQATENGMTLEGYHVHNCRGDYFHKIPENQTLNIYER